MSEKDNPKCWPYNMEFTNLAELMTEARQHAAHKRQIAINFDFEKQVWIMNVMGVPL